MTEATLMTEAATTNEGAVSESTVATTTGVEGEGQSQQAAEGQVTEGQTAEGEKSEEGKPQGAPETYEFKAPEGAEFDPNVIGAFSEVAKELNLPQDAAQKILDKMGPTLAARQTEAIEAVKTQWVESTRADKEFGGDKLAENLAVAKKALDQFGTPELRTLLNESGLGNHPEIIRAFFRAGKAISEDSFVPGGRAAPSDDPAKRLFPNQA